MADPKYPGVLTFCTTEEECLAIQRAAEDLGVETGTYLRVTMRQVLRAQGLIGRVPPSNGQTDGVAKGL